MNQESQRIAIAEECGMRVFRGQLGIWCEPGDIPLPDYLNSLDACHEMEKVLAHPKEQHDYGINLLNVVEAAGHHPNRFAHVTAPAAQRAEAFLRTLNLWEPAPHD